MRSGAPITRDGFERGTETRIDPLTISDAYSRYLFRCQVLKVADYANSKPVFEAAFREYGLPERMRTDNGAPFGSNGDSGLTGLSVWWIKLGIVPERIAPGKPQQNGRHERMHRTLKQETASPPLGNRRAQQERFDNSVKNITRNGRTKRLVKRRREGTMSLRRANIRGACGKWNIRPNGRCGE